MQALLCTVQYIRYATQVKEKMGKEQNIYLVHIGLNLSIFEVWHASRKRRGCAIAVKYSSLTFLKQYTQQLKCEIV